MDWTAIATAHADAIREATTRLRPAAEAAAELAMELLA